MKLVVRAADYGMFDCITDGCIKGMRDGILNSVGLMTNNYEYAVRAVEKLKDFPNASVGQEINLVTGRTACDPKEIPSLVNAEGRFLTSQERIALGNPEITYEDAFREIERQVQLFIELVGHKPEFYAGHSYGTEITQKAMRDVKEKYGLVTMEEIADKAGMTNWPRKWYAIPDTPDGNGRKHYTSDIQKNTPVIQIMFDELKSHKDEEYVHLGTHAGYCDGELCDLSTFNVIRGKELQALCDPEIKAWVRENAQIVTFGQIWEEVKDR